jgi:hypothetical protein
LAIHRALSDEENMTPRQAVVRCLQQFGLSPRDFTERASGEFALALLAALGRDPGEDDPNLRIVFTEDLTESNLPRHAWVFIRGRHYDAETPRGVRDWKDLPVFRRARGED